MSRTGYSWTLPFLPEVPVRNNRVPGLYQHVVWQKDPTLLFIGAVAAGLTFKVFEWQSVSAPTGVIFKKLLPDLAPHARIDLDEQMPSARSIFDFNGQEVVTRVPPLLASFRVGGTSDDADIVGVTLHALQMLMTEKLNAGVLIEPVFNRIAVAQPVEWMVTHR